MDWFRSFIEDTVAWWQVFVTGFGSLVKSANDHHKARVIIRNYLKNNGQMDIAKDLEKEGFVIHMQGNKMIAEKANLKIEMVEE